MKEIGKKGFFPNRIKFREMEEKRGELTLRKEREGEVKRREEEEKEVSCRAVRTAVSLEKKDSESERGNSSRKRAAD